MIGDYPMFSLWKRCSHDGCTYLVCRFKTGNHKLRVMLNLTFWRRSKLPAPKVMLTCKLHSKPIPADEFFRRLEYDRNYVPHADQSNA